MDVYNHYPALERVNYIHNNIDESQNNYAERKKSDQKEHILILHLCKTLEE